MNYGGFEHGGRRYRWDARQRVLYAATRNPNGYWNSERAIDVMELAALGDDARMVAKGALVPEDVIAQYALPGASPAWRWHDYVCRGEPSWARYDAASRSVVVIVRVDGEWLGPYYHRYPSGTFGDATVRDCTRRNLGDGAMDVLNAVGAPSEESCRANDDAHYRIPRRAP